MKMESKINRGQSAFNRELLQMADSFMEETGIVEYDNMTLAAWAFDRGLIEPRRQDTIRLLAKQFASASRQEYTKNENGEPVRTRHPYRIRQGEKQQTFWFKMEDATPEKMKISSQQRRKGIADDVHQAERDIRFYNKHYNPGDPIQTSWNFDIDIMDREQSGEYDDTPPKEGQGDSE